jgi:signal peptidase I
MENTLLVGDFLFVNKFLYGAKIPFTDSRLPGLREPRRGDIIVFKFPLDPRRDFIKRAIGLPGDTLEIRNRVVYVNGRPLEEPYVHSSDDRVRPPGLIDPASIPRAGNADNYGPVRVPEGHLFMMGDNRQNSEDSRYWGFLDENLIKGKALIIYMSWDHERHRPRFGRILDIIH